MNIIQFSVWARTFTQFRFELLKSLQEEGINNIIVCSPEEPHSSILKENKFKLIESEYSKGMDHNLLSSIMQLRNILKKQSPNYLMMHQPMALLIGVLSSIFMKKKLIYFTGGLKANDSMSVLQRSITNFIELNLLKQCHLILSVNKEDTVFLQKKISTKAVYVGPRGGCGIDTEKFCYRKSDDDQRKVELGISPESKVIGLIGRIEKEKGVFYVLETFLENKLYDLDAHLLYIGSGTEDALLINKIQALPEQVKNKVHFVGRQEDIHKWYSVIDIYILASKREGMPTGLLEAMSSSCIVLSTDVRGSREVIKNEVNGLIYKSLSELTASISTVLIGISNYRKLRINARNTIKNDYSKNTLLPKTIKLLLKYLK